MLKHKHQKILFNIFLAIFILKSSFSQQSELTFFAGFSNYLGDLQEKPVTMPNAKLVLGLAYKYPLSSKFWLRGSLSRGKLSAWDGNNTENLRLRNLSFETEVTDGHIAAEYRFFDEERSAITPYIFAGVGMFHYNPFTYYGEKNEKVYLRPLGTEGQGLPEYPEREMYNLTQVMLPVGGGVLWQVTERWNLGLELRSNFTFTDYIDDVSTNYALEAPLLRDRGQLAVDLAWRRDEVDNRPYPTNQGRRGNPDKNDWFYYFGFHIGFKLPNSGGIGNTFYRGGKHNVGCPKW